MSAVTEIVRRTAGAYGNAVALKQAAFGEQVTVAGMQVRVPGPPRVRLSVVAGNMRVHRLIDAAAPAGGLIVDVGAHTGYNTVYAAQRVGVRGRVIAVEPTEDTRVMLHENINRNRLSNVTVVSCAAGAARMERELFVRGDFSAVNSLFAESVYASVTSSTRVQVAPLDDLVDGAPDLVKIDVEGAELDVLRGMSRLLAAPGIQLIVEWHPALQAAAGYAPDALPRFLLDSGFTLRAAGHFGTERLGSADVERVMKRLRASRRPVELAAGHR
ncbi:MAG: FkbM family methyltransferase [Luteitalea sp.]|nr:FkbM family methyltransferase [Luteitalea sp.]